MYICKFCNKECKNTNSLRNHERLCKKNPRRQLTVYEKGINPFLTAAPKTARQTCGLEEQTELYTRQCPYCHKWYKPSQMGGHLVWCLKAPDKQNQFAYTKTCVRLDITNAQLEAYQEAHKQCEICGRTIEESTKYIGKYAPKRLCIDHNHETGKFRGVLCQICNRQLG